MNFDPDRLLTTDEVANYFNVTAYTVNRWEKSGKLKGFKLNRGKRYFAKDVEAFLQSKMQ